MGRPARRNITIRQRRASQVEGTCGETGPQCICRRLIKEALRATGLRDNADPAQRWRLSVRHGRLDRAQGQG